jgi:cell division septum initiation protein DivIVA
MRRLIAIAAIAIVGSCTPARAAGLPRGDPLQRLRAEESAQAAPRDSSRRAGIIWAALGSSAMLLVAITAIQTKRPLRLARVGDQTPEGGAHMRRRLNEREDGGAGQVEEAEAGGQGFAELGQHVATVLATAREAAEKIEGDARSEAATVLERAKAEAAETLSDARDKAAELEAETNEKRSAAIAAAEDIRSRADAYAEKKRQEADEATAEALARAERQARERSRAAEERQQELDSNVERTEERLRKLVNGLRELAGRLDVLVGPDSLLEPEAELDETLKRQVPKPVEVEVEAGSNGQEA